jgi:hypothetical protein
MGITQKQCYSGLRLAVRECDPQGFMALCSFMESEFPGFDLEQEFEEILQKASVKKSSRLRSGVLGYLKNSTKQTKRRFIVILQRFANDRGQSIRESADQLLQSLDQ